MISAASSNAGDPSAHDRHVLGEPLPGEPTAGRDVIAELSDHLIDRAFAIGLRTHNELVRSRRDNPASAHRSTALTTIEHAIAELDKLTHNIRRSIDELEPGAHDESPRDGAPSGGPVHARQR